MIYARWSIPFLLVLVAFVSYAVWIGMPLQAPVNADAKGVLGDSFGVLTSLFSGLGFAGVVLTILMQQGQIKVQQKQIASQEKERVEEVNERRSLFNLNAAIDATEQARILLENWNNVRRTWIEAGRLLGHAKVLGDGVTIDCHKRVLEANKLKYRAFFSELIEHKTAAFFYGVDDALNTDDAARASTAPSERSGTRSLNSVRYLDEAAIYRVWEAAQWPSDFDDPVSQTFSPQERDKLIFNVRGLHEYLDHKDRWASVFGELIRRE